MDISTTKTKEEAENDIIESIALMNESIAKIMEVESMINSLTILSFILQKKLNLIVKNPPSTPQA